jgi:cytidylate kinase
MNRVEHIERYVAAQLATDRKAPVRGVDPAIHPFVTISRQAGTGGHELADTILDVFAAESDAGLFRGWQVYDRSVCEIVARDRRFATSLDSLLEEEYRSRANDFFHQVVRSTVDQNMVMDRVFLVVRTIARMGRAIIVGRAGAQVTRGMEQGISLRVVAPEPVRIARVMEIHGISEREARAGCRKRDADRARLIRSQFGADVADPAEYDIVANVGHLDRRHIARAVATLVAERARSTHPARTP